MLENPELGPGVRSSLVILVVELTEGGVIGGWGWWGGDASAVRGARRGHDVDGLKGRLKGWLKGRSTSVWGFGSGSAGLWEYVLRGRRRPGQLWPMVV